MGFFQQFYKFPILVNHFIEHNQIHHVTFVDFLEMHYWGNDLDDDDDDRDLQLPFKSSCGHIFHAVFVPTDKPIVDLPNRTLIEQRNETPYIADICTDLMLQSIFRPPVFLFS